MHYWDAIGTENYYFRGHYDGGKHTISGFYTKTSPSYQGLFGYVRGQSETNMSTIKNVGIIDSDIQGYSYVGGVVGRAYYSTVTNCYNTGAVYGDSYIGGVVGGAYYSTVTNCYNTGSVSGSSGYVSGVVGYASSYSTITNCYNTGSVYGQGYYVGGVVGGAEHHSTVTNCYNIGTVTGNYHYVGGVVGEAYYSTVTNCYNTSNVTGVKTVGGVVGRAEETSITNCYNTGSVAERDYAGGVVGYVNTADITNNYYGGNCTLSYGIGGSSSNTGASNTGASKDENLIANAKSLSWYQDSSKWSSRYPWDFENAWTIVPGVNDGFPILQYAVDDIMRESGIVSEIYNDAEGKMDEENVRRLLEYLLGESDVDVTAKETMDKLNALAGNTMTSADIRDKNDGTDITVRFGGLDWTVTYLSKDNAGNNILTLWLSSSQQDAFAGRTATEGTLYGFINNSLYSDWSNDRASNNYSSSYPDNMYGRSYIRSITLNNGGEYSTSGSAKTTATQNENSVFARFTMEGVEGSLTQYITTPSKMSWQTYQSSAATNPSLSYYYPNDSIEDPVDKNLAGSWQYSYMNYENKDGYKDWANDYIWLPSLAEAGYDTSNIGLWETSTEQRKNFSSSLNNNGTVGSANVKELGAYNYSWLRSGHSNVAYIAYSLYPSGGGEPRLCLCQPFSCRPSCASPKFIKGD